MQIAERYNKECKDLFDQLGLENSTIRIEDIQGLSGNLPDSELFLLHNFGGCGGMVLVPTQAGYTLEQIDEIWNAGFGCSVIDFSGEELRADMVDVLMDWGWTGQPGDKPGWLERD